LTITLQVRVGGFEVFLGLIRPEHDAAGEAVGRCRNGDAKHNFFAATAGADAAGWPVRRR
jgi:hypothetical protein